MELLLIDKEDAKTLREIAEYIPKHKLFVEKFFPQTKKICTPQPIKTTF